MAGQTVSLLSPLTTADTASTVVNKINTDLSSLAVELARKVTPGDMLVTSDLSMVGHYLTETAGVVLEDTGLSPSGLGTVYYSGGDFWLVTAGGAVQITKSGAVNVASAGGINGDYPGASGATVTYTHSTTTYDFRDSASVWAKAKVKSLYISNAGDTAALELKNVAASACTVTFSDLPVTSAGVYHLVTIDSAGGLKYNDTVDAAVTFNAGFTTATDQKHTDTWTGRVNIDSTRIGNNVALVQPGGVTANDPVYGIIGTLSPWQSSHNVNGLRVGDKITSVSVRVTKLSAVAVTVELKKYDIVAGTYVTVLTGTSSAGSGTVTITAATGTPLAITANDQYIVKISGTTDFTSGCYNITYTYTHP